MAGRLTIDDDNHPVPGGVTILGSILSDTTIVAGSVNAKAVAMVDGSGNQIVSFGGGTQYTDGGVPPTHPIGNTIEWSDGSNWQTVSTAKPLPVSLASGFATATNQTGGTQKTQIVDGSGNVIGATSNALDVNIKSSTTLTVASHAVTNAGTFAVQSTPVTQADTFMLGGVNIKEINGVAPLMGVGATGTGAQRTVVANDTGRTLTSKGGNAASSGNNTLVVAGTNRLKVYAFSLSIVSTTAVTCIFQSGASGTELWRVTLQTPASVAGGANLVVQPPAWLFATASATLLNLNLSAAVSVDWAISYFDEA